MTDIEARRAELAARYLIARARRDEAVTELDSIAAQLRELGTGPAGEHVVTVTPRKVFDPATATVVLPPEQLRAITVPLVDPATAKRVLPPAAYDACRVESGKASVTVR